MKQFKASIIIEASEDSTSEDVVQIIESLYFSEGELISVNSQDAIIVSIEVEEKS